MITQSLTLAPACFQQCPDKPGTATLDPDSSCYLQCYARAVYAAAAKQLTDPWNAAFAGGCPPAEVTADFHNAAQTSAVRPMRARN